MRDLLFIVEPRRREFVCVLLLGLVVNAGLTVVSPLFLKLIFDEGIAARNMQLFVAVLGIFMLIATAWRLMGLHLALRIQRLKNDLGKAIVDRTVRKYYRLPYPATVQSPPGYFASRMFDEPVRATAGAVDVAIDVSSTAVSFLSATVLLAFLSLRATVLLAACVPVLIWLAGKYGAAIKREAEAEKEAEAGLRGFLTKAIQAYRTVRLLELESVVLSGLGASFASFAARTLERLRASCVHSTLGSIFMSYAETAVIVVCGYEMMRGRMTFGGFMGFMSAFWAAVNATRLLSQKVPEVSQNIALIGRIRSFLAAEEVLDKCAAGPISLRKAGLGYGSKLILPKLDLAIGRDERILLVGRNGSGKSTLASLLTGFIEPIGGAANVPALSRVSAALAPHHFVPGTVADNLGSDRLGKKPREYLNALLEEFELADALARDPETLSSGQRKKVEIIAALLKDADLYVFDEPLANVDEESKAAIVRRILERTRGKSLIVVLHGDERFRKDFDRVIDLDAVTPQVPASRQEEQLLCQ